MSAEVVTSHERIVAALENPYLDEFPTVLHDKWTEAVRDIPIRSGVTN